MAAGEVTSWRPLTGQSQRLSLVRGPRRALAVDEVAVLPASGLSPGVSAATVDGVHPLLSPAAYPWQVPGPQPGRVTTLQVVGDVMLGRRVAAANPGPDPAAALRPFAEQMRRSDLTVANLESTLSTAGTPQQGGDSFAVPPATAGALARIGVDAVSLANNHTGDFGEEALRRTLRTLQRSPLRHVGAGVDLDAASRAAVMRVNGLRVGLIGFNAIGETPRATATTPGALSVSMPPRTGPLDRVDLRRVSRLVRDLRDQADVVVVLPHWGAQYTHVAVPAQRQVARELAAAGADLVVGGHPHWVQGLELVGDTVVAHSLGNLVFDMDFMEQTMEGVTLTAVLWDDEVKGVTLTPYRMDARFRPRVVDGPAGAAILADVWRHSTGPFAG